MTLRSAESVCDMYLDMSDAGLLFALSQLLPVRLLPAPWCAVRKRLWPADGMGGTLPVQSASTTSASSLGRMICPPCDTKWHSLAALQCGTHSVPGMCVRPTVLQRLCLLPTLGLISHTATFQKVTPKSRSKRGASSLNTCVCRKGYSLKISTLACDF